MLHGIAVLWALLQGGRFWDIARDTAEVVAQPVATITAGFIVGYGAWLGFRASRESRLSTERLAQERNRQDEAKAMRDHMREVMSARQQRYTTIADQLASQHVPVRLAGASALSALADEWGEAGDLDARDSAIELLCAYLRSAVRDDDLDVRKAAIFSIRAHLQDGINPKWPGTSINLSKAILTHADFRGCNFSDVNLDEAVLDWADLSECTFKGVSARGTYFISTTFHETNMNDVLFQGCHFDGAKIVNSGAADTNFAPWVAVGPEGFKSKLCSFRGARILNSDLSGSDFSKAVIGTPNDGPETFFASSFVDKVYEDWERMPYNSFYNEFTRWPPQFDIKETISRQLEESGYMGPPPLP